MATVTADNKGRITLGARFAGKTLRIEQIDQFEIRAQVVETIPAREAWLWKNKAAMASVRRGLAQAAAGDLHDLDLDAEAPFVKQLED